jgi:hypothetical protein
VKRVRFSTRARGTRFDRNIRLRRPIVLLLIAFLSGCANGSCCIRLEHESGQSVRYFILGVGVVTVPKPSESSGIVATRVSAFGLTVSEGPGLKLGLGYSASSVVAIPASIKNALVEVGSCTPDGITINTSQPEIAGNQ